MPDSYGYGETVAALDQLRKGAMKKNKTPSVAESQLANLQVHADKTRTSLEAAHKEFRDALSANKKEPELNEISDRILALKHRLEYYRNVSDEISTADNSMFSSNPFGTVASNPAAANQMRADAAAAAENTKEGVNGQSAFNMLLPTDKGYDGNMGLRDIIMKK